MSQTPKKCEKCGHQYFRWVSSEPILASPPTWRVEQYECADCGHKFIIAKPPKDKNET